MAGSELIFGIVIAFDVIAIILLIMIIYDLIQIKKLEKRYNKYADDTNIEWKNGKPTLIEKEYKETRYVNDEATDKRI